MWFLHYCDSVSTGIWKLERDECCFRDVNTKHCSTVQTSSLLALSHRTLIRVHSDKSLARRWSHPLTWYRERHASYLPRSTPQTTDSMVTQNTDMESRVCLLLASKKTNKWTKNKNEQKLLKRSVIWESHNNRQFLKAELKKNSFFFFLIMKKWVEKGELRTLCLHIKVYVLLTR